MPITRFGSLRAPAFTHTPSIALSSSRIGSVITVKPLESLEISGVMGRDCSGDMVAHQAQIVGQSYRSFGALNNVLEAGRNGRKYPRSPLHGLGKFGQMGSG